MCLRILCINVNTFFKIKSTLSPPAPQLLYTLIPLLSSIFVYCFKPPLSTYSVANMYLGVGQTEDQGNKFLKKTDSFAPQQSPIANNSSAKSKTSWVPPQVTMEFWLDLVQVFCIQLHPQRVCVQYPRHVLKILHCCNPLLLLTLKIFLLSSAMTPAPRAEREW